MRRWRFVDDLQPQSSLSHEADDLRACVSVSESHSLFPPILIDQIKRFYSSWRVRVAKRYRERERKMQSWAPVPKLRDQGVITDQRAPAASLAAEQLSVLLVSVGKAPLAWLIRASPSVCWETDGARE